MELTCVQVALPESVKYLAHVCEAVNAYLTPLSLDNAVSHGCMSVLQRYHWKPCSTLAMKAAVGNSHYTAVKWLVDVGKLASTSIILNHALIRASTQGKRDAVALLADDCSDDAVEKALQYATRKEKWDVVQVLYTKCKARCRALGEALKTAAKMGREDIVELLWRECEERDIARALEDAAHEGHWKVVQLLFAHCHSDKEIGAALICAIKKANWEMVKILYLCAGKKNIEEALKLVAIQRQWNVARLLCEQLQTRRYDEALELVERDDGRALLDLLYRRCRCYDAEKAVVEGTKSTNWTVIKLLADMCYQNSTNVCKAFKLAVEMGQWDVVKRLHNECSSETVTWAMTQAAERGEGNVVRLLELSCYATIPATPLKPIPAEKKDERLEAKPFTIRCIAPGDRPFEIQVASTCTVKDLKHAIRNEKLDCFGEVTADSIWIYSTKRGGEWLHAGSEAIARLELGDSFLVRDLLVWQVMSTYHVQNMLEGATQQSAIHVIAVKPMLRCIAPGSRHFGVNMNAMTQVIHLKRAIKSEMPDDFKNVDASELELYAAKENGKWLLQSSDEAKALMLGDGSPKLTPTLARQLSSITELGNPFADVFAIHIIIMSPNRVLDALRHTPAPAKTDRFHLDTLRMKLLQL